MNGNNTPGLGDQIKNIVEDVVDSRNFERLNRDISDTVNSALWEVHNRLHGNMGIPNRPEDRQQGGSERAENRQQRYEERAENRQQKYADNRQQKYAERADNRQQRYDQRNFDRSNNTWTQTPRSNQAPSASYKNRYNEAKSAYASNAANVNKSIQVYKRNNPQTLCKTPYGSVAGILFKVFGFIGIGVSGLLLFIFIMISIFYYGGILFANGAFLAVLLPILLGSVIMSSRGIFLRKRVARFKKYVIQFNGKTYCSIKELASHLGESEKYVVKDLKKMIRLGMFPQGHIDSQKTCLMLTSETYEQYLKSQDELEKRKQETVQRDMEDDKTKEFRQAMEEGKEYIRQIKEVNDAIPEEEISNKLYRMEQVISKIFDYVEQHPEQMTEIHKFMNYYLPTTLKLMNAYKEFDTQPIQGDNISTAKNEIRKTLDTINLAFENLLDSLFEDAAMDVSTDISVLQTMLAQEGLTEKDFLRK